MKNEAPRYCNRPWCFEDSHAQLETPDAVLFLSLLHLKLPGIVRNRAEPETHKIQNKRTKDAKKLTRVRSGQMQLPKSAGKVATTLSWVENLAPESLAKRLTGKQLSKFLLHLIEIHTPGSKVLSQNVEFHSTFLGRTLFQANKKPNS